MTASGREYLPLKGDGEVITLLMLLINSRLEYVALHLINRGWGPRRRAKLELIIYKCINIFMRSLTALLTPLTSDI